jgi:hypothetical protein
MQVITARISRQELFEKYATEYQVMTKAVVDLARGSMAVDAEWHADLEALLLDDGSDQEDLWGINLMLTAPADSFIQYDSLINIRPAQQSFATTLTDPPLIQRIKAVVDSLVDYADGLSVREPAAEYEPGEYVRPKTTYPCFAHHKKLTLEKWRAFEPYKRVIMISNEFGRAQGLVGRDSVGLSACYERALELFHITIEAGRTEQRPRQLIHDLLRLRERTGRIYAGRIGDAEENGRLREECIALEPEAWRLTHPDAVEA